MKAAVVEHRDELGSIRELPDPVAGNNELLVRVTAAGVNPVDWKQRDLYNRPTPFVLGQDFAGIVVAVGSPSSKYAIGDRIFGIAREHGSYAERTIVPEEYPQQPVCHIPDDIGDADAAALPTAALTALGCVDFVQAGQNTSIVVIGATGGVGLFALQIAKARGASVIAIAHSGTESLAREYGADQFIAYDRENRIERLTDLDSNGVDGIIDLVDDTSSSGELAKVLRSGGAIVSTIGGLDLEFFTSRGYRAMNLVMNQTPQSSHEGLRELLTLMHQGSLQTHITEERPLDEAIDALERVKSGSMQGKAIVTVDNGVNAT